MPGLRHVPVPRARARIALTLTLVMIALLAGLPAEAGRGRWTPSQNWGNTAVHLLLMRGDGSPDHSRILFYSEHHDTTIYGGLWGWTPASDDCSNYPTSSFVARGVVSAPINLFCAGHAPLDDGRLFFAGGTETGTENGKRQAEIFTAGTGTGGGSWASPPPDSMSERRWYPTVTALPDGRMLVSSGSSYLPVDLFGGKRNGSLNPTDSLHRFGIVGQGQWDASVVPRGGAGPNGGRPTRRESHAMSKMPYYGNTVLFGGYDTSTVNPYKQDVWFLYRRQNPLGSDWDFQWQGITTAGEAPARRDHTAHMAYDTLFIVFGGHNQFTVHNDVHRLYNKLDQGDTTRTWTWQFVNVSAPNGSPGARYGHGSVWDPQFRRMLVFGGAGTVGGDPADNSVWALTIDSTAASGAWSKVTVRNPTVGPGPRLEHTFEYDALPHHGGTLLSTVLFGGKRSASGSYSDSLWVLWLHDNGEVEWEPVAAAGSVPRARASHSCTVDAEPQRVLIYGGVTASGAADDTVWAVNLNEATPTWRPYAAKGVSLSNHTAWLDFSNFARVSEIYDPRDGSWEALDSSPLFQGWYPQQFVLPGGATPGGTVFSVGPNSTSYVIDLGGPGQAASAWSPLPAVGPGFAPISAVMYRPGKVMAAGGASNKAAIGTTRRIDLNPGATDSVWTASESMQPRYNHNLVLLPTGEVLAVGGVGTTSNTSNQGPVYRPQLWNPDGNGGSGGWSGWNEADSLSSDPHVRGYHSSALLLPDGRVLVAGGNGPSPGGHPHQWLANLFCPPYLFDAAGGTARRPVVEVAPERLTYGQPITVCTAGSDTIVGGCLIRAGAATHGFDQNQRYIPMTATRATNPTRYFLSAPADSTVAPPGEYLLFVLAPNGATQVPSVGRWIRVQGAPAVDTCDAVAPADEIEFVAELVSSSYIGVAWYAPGDDEFIPESGRPTYGLRWGVSPITNDSQYQQAGLAAHPAVQWAGGGEDHGFNGLMANTWYYFGIKSHDDHGHVSALRYTAGKTLSGGGGMGGSVTQAGDEDGAAGSAASSARPRAPASAARVAGARPVAESSAQVGAPAMVWEMERDGAAVEWRARLADPATLAGVEQSSGAAVLIQRPDDAGGWVTRTRFVPALGDDRVGVCVPRGQARVVLVGGWEIDELTARARTAAGTALVLTAVSHSSEGALSPDSAVVEPSRLALSGQETLTLRFAPAEGAAAQASATEEPWHLVLRRSGSAPAARRGPSTEPSPSRIPTAFALLQNRPNPFRGTTTIGFDLPVASGVRLEVFDLAGRRVRTLARNAYPAGSHALEWDQRDDAGRSVRAGIYLYRLHAGAFRSQRRMVLMP